VLHEVAGKPIKQQISRVSPGPGLSSQRNAERSGDVRGQRFRQRHQSGTVGGDQVGFGEEAVWLTSG